MRMDFGVRRVSCLLCLLLISQFSLGCGGQDGPLIAPVKGVVTVNGTPVGGVEVSFRVKDHSRVSVGVTNDKGEFQLTTLSTNDGAIVGENLVAIGQPSKDAANMAPAMDPEAMKRGTGKSDFKGPSKPLGNPSQILQNSNGVVPPKYGNPEKSGLKRTVVLGEKNIFDFELKP